jgi:hypothetical protein
MVSMSRTRVSHLQSCAAQGTGPDGDLACRTYHLPGGVSVQEALLGDGPSPKGGADRYVVAVTVLRADGFAVSFQASSYRFDTFHEKGLTTRPPMTIQPACQGRRRPALVSADAARLRRPRCQRPAARRPAKGLKPSR